MTVDAGIEITGVDDVAAALRAIGPDADAQISEALGGFGRLVVSQAQTLAPKKTGAMAEAITSTYVDNTLTVRATAPQAYTFHAVAMGLSGGYMVFRVGGHYRAGSFISGYSARRRIPNNPFVFAAFLKLQADLERATETALTEAVT